MKKRSTKLIALLLLSAGLANVHGGVIQVGDFRIGSNDYTVNTYFDPGFTNATRGVAGAPVNVNSTFTGTTQNPGGTTPDSATDIGLRTYTSATVIRTLSRYSSTTAAGMVQWNFDLSPLDSYLSDNGLSLTALDIDLVMNLSDDTKAFDVYLSYDNAAEGISLTGISATSATDNYNNFCAPALAAGEGNIANGTHKVLKLETTGDQTVNDSLLALYNSGVREFNLQIAASSFLSSRTLSIEEDSGLSITTIPEPATFGLFGLFGAAAIFIRKRLMI